VQRFLNRGQSRRSPRLKPRQPRSVGSGTSASKRRTGGR
jgi:hypothetical protein